MLERNYNLRTRTRRGGFLAVSSSAADSNRIKGELNGKRGRSEERRNRVLMVDQDAGELSKAIL